jgi:hypothetical protein
LVLLPGLVVILGAVMGGFVLAGQRFKQVEHHVFFQWRGRKRKRKQKESRSLVKSRTHLRDDRIKLVQRWRPPVSLSLSIAFPTGVDPSSQQQQQQPEEIPRNAHTHTHTTLPTTFFTPDQNFFFFFFSLSCVDNKSTRCNTLGNCCLGCFQQHLGHVFFVPPRTQR